jgi:ferritin
MVAREDEGTPVVKPFAKEAATLISAEMNAALNEQIGREFGASLQYVQIASYFDSEGLPELARYFYRQAEEERGHAMRLVRYIVDANGQVRVPAVPAPRQEFASVEEAVGLSLEHELRVTDQINNLMDLAIQQNDHITRNFLEWFVREQLEEVASMDTLLRMVRRAGEPGLLWIENYLARRGHGALAEPEEAPAGEEAEAGE